ncbi:hypothetical protein [Phocaeicola coprophilus]|jgi:hypothetical protein|uniref:hypothetical protein n=1 Tax=Phocaeicola coprophilus TaxID=387090 RepID=UPI0022E07669|nr:hypothetical protein [Phocaeicola coprophilus]
MDFENVKIQVALIALVSALLGSIVTATINYLFQQRSESRKQIREKQKEVYFRYLTALQEFKNSSNNVRLFNEFQNAVNAICLYGDNNTSLAVKDYFEALVKVGNKELTFQSCDYINHETKIINAMRDSLGLKKFDKFIMVRADNLQ